jgi:histamine receptor H3
MNERIKESVRVIGRDSRINRDRKAARSLFILVFVFLIFLFPYVICATASTAGFHIPAMIFEVSFWLLWLNSTCNPFLYPFIQIKYRRAYAKLFHSCFKHFHFRQSN